ncbi:hypothetical protein ABZ297_04975 [Nonomuraea sp. NPDC005983]|uniref:hypothetical protein n=1 Tax=Nonomuraea sp. NPDC005983 TaxID=3155595 RepID=UPI0033B66987
MTMSPSAATRSISAWVKSLTPPARPPPHISQAMLRRGRWKRRKAPTAGNVRAAAVWGVAMVAGCHSPGSRAKIINAAAARIGDTTAVATAATRATVTLTALELPAIPSPALSSRRRQDRIMAP